MISSMISFICRCLVPGIYMPCFFKGSMYLIQFILNMDSESIGVISPAMPPLQIIPIGPIIQST